MSATKTRARKQGLPLFPIAIGVIVLLGVVAIVVTAAGSDGDGSAEETRPVTLTGESLPAMVERGRPDPAIGLPVPEIAGENFDGEAVTIERDGRAKIVVFVAHWCHVCQAEVPKISDHLKQTGMPDAVDLYFVSTGVNRAKGSFPPSEWLTREGVGDVPTVADDAESQAFTAFGGSSFPFMAYVDADGKVALRTAGSLPDGAFGAYADALANGEALPAF